MLEQVVKDLLQAAEVTSMPISRLDLKSRMRFRANASLRARDAEGKARRRSR